MPLTNLQIYERWVSKSQLVYRVYGAMLRYAVTTVKPEPAGTTNHVNRLALANRVTARAFVVDDVALADMYTRVIQRGPIISAGDEATDGQIDGAVSAEWDASATALAGG